MEAIYVDLHIHTSENADNLNKSYNIDELIRNINKEAKGRQALISLTDHNTINKDAYLKFINKTRKWLNNELSKKKINLDNIFYAFYKDDEIYVIENEN